MYHYSSTDWDCTKLELEAWKWYCIWPYNIGFLGFPQSRGCVPHISMELVDFHASTFESKISCSVLFTSQLLHTYNTGQYPSQNRARFTNVFFHRNSNSMENSFHYHLDSNTVIATKFCSWHNSCAVVACTKICCDPMASNKIRARRSFHLIWIMGKKSSVKRAPGSWDGRYHICSSHVFVPVFSSSKTASSIQYRSPSTEVRPS